VGVFSKAWTIDGVSNMAPEASAPSCLVTVRREIFLVIFVISQKRYSECGEVPADYTAHAPFQREPG
jgi:hypothetical protein